MSHAFWILALILLVIGPAPQSPPFQPAAQTPGQDVRFDHSHAAWTAIVRRCVQGGRFDYRALSDSRGPLDEYLLRLRGVRPQQIATWARLERFAYWINAYNAFTVHAVLTRYPVESIDEVGTDEESIWERRLVPLGHLVGGMEAERISLESIEDEVLRPLFQDARVHAALSRAAESGPPLASEAYQAERLELQLERQARAWLADPSLNRFDREDGQLELSALFEWRRADFERDAGSVRAWIVRYAPKAEAEWLAEAEDVELEFLPFSWQLDDVGRKER
jgi:hypothetical protein